MSIDPDRRDQINLEKLADASAGGKIPTPSDKPEVATEGLVLVGWVVEKLILLETEEIATTSGEMFSAEEGATVRDNLVSETEETGCFGVVPRFILE